MLLATNLDDARCHNLKAQFGAGLGIADFHRLDLDGARHRRVVFACHHRPRGLHWKSELAHLSASLWS